MRRSHAEAEYEVVHINVVPLIDVMFFLVLFFVATSSFVKETGIDINRPAADTATVQEKGNIVISVTRNGDFWIDQRQVDVRALRGQIERLLIENPDSTVIVAADSAAPTKYLVEALDQARLAGVENVAVAASETGQGP